MKSILSPSNRNLLHGQEHTTFHSPAQGKGTAMQTDGTGTLLLLPSQGADSHMDKSQAK